MISRWPSWHGVSLHVVPLHMKSYPTLTQLAGWKTLRQLSQRREYNLDSGHLCTYHVMFNTRIRWAIVTGVLTSSIRGYVITYGCPFFLWIRWSIWCFGDNTFFNVDFLEKLQANKCCESCSRWSVHCKISKQNHLWRRKREWLALMAANVWVWGWVYNSTVYNIKNTTWSGSPLLKQAQQEARHTGLLMDK